MRNGKPLIIFAEDYEDTLKMEMLAAHFRGWEAIGVKTARELIDVVNNVCPGATGQCCVDCIVADIQFHQDDEPRVTGITAINSIRKRYPNIPVLYYSAYISALTRKLIREQGEGVEALEKPVGVKELLDRVGKLMTLTIPYHDGDERRNTSINHLGYTRRSTDRPATIPRSVEQSLQNAKAKTAGNPMEDWVNGK